MELVKHPWRVGTAQLWNYPRCFQLPQLPLSRDTAVPTHTVSSLLYPWPSPGTCALFAFLSATTTPLHFSKVKSHKMLKENTTKGQTFQMNSIHEGTLPLHPCCDQFNQKHALT